MIKRFLKMTWMETKLFLREPVGVFFTLAFPLMYLFLFGAISGNEPSPLYNGQNAIEASIPSLTAMIIGTTGLMSTTITMATYREGGVLRRLQTTPVGPLFVMGAQVTVVFFMTLVGTLLLVLAGWIFYGVTIAGNWFSFLLGFILSSLSFFGIGFMLAGVMPSARTAQIVGLVLLYPMMLLSGTFFPLALLPGAIQKVADYLPMTYVVNLLRGLWMGEAWGSYGLNIAVLAGLLVLGVIVSALTFRWE
jgi:ABC-2 type transport system permease protein